MSIQSEQYSTRDVGGELRAKSLEREAPAGWKCKELFLGVFLAVLLVMIYHARKVDADNLALGPQNTSAVETWQEKPFTASSPSTIKSLVTQLSDGSSEESYWLWLGNSQLHTINQKNEGDHLAPYWLRENLGCADCARPIGVTLPNANLQEHLVLERFIHCTVNLKGLILPMVFDDLREDGIREELADLIDSDLESDLGKSSAGRTILRGIKEASNKGAAVNMNAASSLNDDFQKRLEHALEAGLGYYFPLWNERSHLKALFTIDLYYARNWLLNIKSTTVRKIIEPRYERNMQAFRDLLAAAQREEREVLVYIAPIRQDLSLPYEMKRYERWKQVVEELAHEYGARFLNLETLVPPEYWGTYHKDDVDFMHFQGRGHQLLAKEIAEAIGR